MKLTDFRTALLPSLPARIRRAVLRETRERLRRMVRYAGGLLFDALFRVNTRGIIPPNRLVAPGVDGVSYEGTSPLGFLRLLRRLPIDPARFTFIDLGCGKGRTLILAARSQFRRAVGVEISPDVLAVAQRNVAVFSHLRYPADARLRLAVRERQLGVAVRAGLLLTPFRPEEASAGEAGAG